MNITDIFTILLILIILAAGIYGTYLLVKFYFKKKAKRKMEEN